jgi:hypothetical protein
MRLDFTLGLQPVIKLMARLTSATLKDLVGAVSAHFRKALGRRAGVRAVADRLGYQFGGSSCHGLKFRSPFPCMVGAVRLAHGLSSVNTGQELGGARCEQRASLLFNVNCWPVQRFSALLRFSGCFQEFQFGFVSIMVLIVLLIRFSFRF